MYLNCNIIMHSIQHTETWGTNTIYISFFYSFIEVTVFVYVCSCSWAQLGHVSFILKYIGVLPICSIYTYYIMCNIVYIITICASFFSYSLSLSLFLSARMLIIWKKISSFNIIIIRIVLIYFIRLFIERARLCLMFTYHSFISMNQICNRAALNCIKKKKKQIIQIINDGIIHNHLVRICLYAWISVIF